MADRVVSEALHALVDRVKSGHVVRGDEIRALLDAGCNPDAMVLAFVAAAEGPHSRAFHRALGLLRDLTRRR